MNTVIYDSRRIFWPQNAPASAIPIKIHADTDISSVTNVQDAIQALVNGIDITIDGLPDEITQREDKTLNKTISTLNEVIRALNNLQKSKKS